MGSGPRGGGFRGKVLLGSELEEGPVRDSVQMRGASELGQLDEELNLKEVCAEFRNETAGGRRSAAGGEEVVDQDDPLPWLESVFMDFNGGLAVLQLVGSGPAAEREFALFPNGHESDAEFVGDNRAKKEAAGVDAGDNFGLERSGGL